MQKTFPSIERVGVIGAGVIGASWSTLFLAAGKDVDLFDPAPDAESGVRQFVQNAWLALEVLELVQPGASPERLRFATDAPTAVSRAQFMQESVPARLALKLETYRAIEPTLAPEAVVATSSSGLLLADMQAGWRDPGRFILGHLFNPPHLIPLVELLDNERTDANVIDAAAAFYERCGKVTIRVRRSCIKIVWTSSER